MSAMPDLPPADADAQAADLEVTRARRDLPARDERVYDCHLGRIALTVGQWTEADPLAVMATLLAAAGVALGTGPHVQAGDDRHPLLVWPLIAGRTSAGRKGASWSTARRIIRAADPLFAGSGGNIRSGLTSGEGLAALFAVGEDAPPAGPDDAPAASGGLPPGDVRLLVFEPEWAAVMARMKREANALSATLRAAWEGGDLSTMNVKARHAPTSHIGIVAHITPKEFAARVSAADMAGGTYNRFLPLYVARARFLPLSSGADPELVAELGAALDHRLTHGTALGQIGFTTDGARAWRRLYVEFGTDHGDDGPVEQFIARAAPNALRVAAIHAALDGADQIGPAHLIPAAALVRYAIASARALFGSDPTLTRLAAYITDAGPAGRTREDIRDEHFQRHKTTREIDRLLTQLTDTGHVTVTTRPRADGRAGKPARVYTAAPPAGSRAVSALGAVRPPPAQTPPT